MSSTIAGIAVVVVLAAWHLRTRRHPHWQTSADARFYISLGYPFMAVAVYFLAGAGSRTDLDWVLGNVWALISVSLFVYGFQALGEPPEHPAGHGDGGRRPRVSRGASRRDTARS